MSTNTLWSSNWNFILAATGAAVGLGNIWKFPYMVGTYGGSAFVFVYLLCVAGIGVPLMIAEMVLGKLGRGSVVASLERLVRQHSLSPSWRILGWWGAVTLLLILSFYAVVAGWSLHYLGLCLSGKLLNATPASLAHTWQALLASPKQLMLCQLSFLALTFMVVAKGLNQGLERASRTMMPALLIILVVLVGYATGLPGFSQAVTFLFHMQWQRITPDVAISALGHALFTLAVGAGCLLSYGAYLPKDANIHQAVRMITVLDVLVAFLSGLAIYPIIFTYQLSPGAGPGLMFQILPVAFAHMGGGQVIGSLFFLLLLFAAWTSSISLAEPLVMLCLECGFPSRRIACLSVFTLSGALGAIASLSFNIIKDVQFVGHTLFTLLTDTSTNVLLPLGGLGFATLAWVLPTQTLTNALQRSEDQWGFRLWRFCLRVLTPLGVGVLLLASALQ